MVVQLQLLAGVFFPQALLTVVVVLQSQEYPTPIPSSKPDTSSNQTGWILHLVAVADLLC